VLKNDLVLRECSIILNNLNTKIEIIFVLKNDLVFHKRSIILKTLKYKNRNNICSKKRSSAPQAFYNSKIQNSKLYFGVKAIKYYLNKPPHIKIKIIFFFEKQKLILYFCALHEALCSILSIPPQSAAGHPKGPHLTSLFLPLLHLKAQTVSLVASVQSFSLTKPSNFPKVFGLPWHSGLGPIY